MTAYGKKILYLCVIGVVIAGAYVAGVYTGYANKPITERITGVINKSEGQPEDVDFTPFWQAWKVIDDRFVPTHEGLGSTTIATSTATVASNQERVYGAIQGMFRALGDPYTVFFPPEEAKMFQDEVNGSFSGVGMEIGIRDGVLTVVAPLTDTPAFRAGIRSGDRIVKIDGRQSADMAVDIAVREIRGKKGSTVVLTIERDDEGPIDISIVRDTIIIPTISTEGNSSITDMGKGHEGIRPDGVFVIRLYNFSAQSPELFRRALETVANSGSDKLLLDLRGNPGGYLEAAVDIASWFLPEGKVVVSERMGTGSLISVNEHKSRGYVTQLPKLPRVAILIDGGSASASEILAGSLSEHGVAIIVGERSFGKGSVQELVPITADTEAKVTIARWFTPNGLSISDSGLTPDHEVKITREDVDNKVDPQFDKALEVLKDNNLWK